MIYIILFILSALILKKNQGANINIIPLIFVCFLFALFSGLRNVNVGTDTSGYPLTAYEEVLSSSNFSDYLIAVAYSAYMKEIGYAALVYICANLFHNFNFMLFICALIVNGGYMYFLY